MDLKNSANLCEAILRRGLVGIHIGAEYQFVMRDRGCWVKQSEAFLCFETNLSF